MREIKFRVWDKKRKRMFAATTINASGDVSVFIDDDGLYLLPAEQVELMQYTGLKDKNDKDIYDGDILGGIWESGFISWCEKCKQFQYHSVDIGCMACSGDVHWYEIAEDDGKLEVIGNIYENHELLEDR